MGRPEALAFLPRVAFFIFAIWSVWPGPHLLNAILVAEVPYSMLCAM